MNEQGLNCGEFRVCQTFFWWAYKSQLDEKEYNGTLDASR